MAGKKWNFDFYDACLLTIECWNLVSVDTIVNCFNRAFSFDRNTFKPSVHNHLSLVSTVEKEKENSSKLLHDKQKVAHSDSASASASSDSAAASAPSASASIASSTTNNRSGLNNFVNTCYINSFLQAVSSAVDPQVVQAVLASSSVGSFSNNVCMVVQQLQQNLPVVQSVLRNVVAVFRQTLAKDEMYKPQDVMDAFNAFMTLLRQSGGDRFADAFRIGLTNSSVCTECGGRDTTQHVYEQCSMLGPDFQGELNEWSIGRLAQAPQKDVCGNPECGKLCARTHFRTFDVPPDNLVIFRHSTFLLRSLPECIVAANCAYQLQSIIINTGMHYVTVFREGIE
jgi:hypothetical protein